MGDGFLKICHNQPQAALAIGQTEPPLHFHPLTFVREIPRLVADISFFGLPSAGSESQMPCSFQKRRLSRF
jgi:hypothetical protein